MPKKRGRPNIGGLHCYDVPKAPSRSETHKQLKAWVPNENYDKFKEILTKKYGESNINYFINKLVEEMIDIDKQRSGKK